MRKQLFDFFAGSFRPGSLCGAGGFWTGSFRSVGFRGAGGFWTGGFWPGGAGSACSFRGDGGSCGGAARFGRFFCRAALALSAASALAPAPAGASSAGFSGAGKGKASYKAGYKAHEAPAPLKGLEIRERLGSSIDLDLVFRSEKGEAAPLSLYFGSQPVLMTMIYYNCPSLCNFHLNGLFRGLQGLSLTKSKAYRLAAVSMDSREGPALAKEKKANYLKKFSLPEGRTHFLTGSEGSIKKLADQLGFAFRWDEETEQFAHSPVAYVLTPEGLISRYLYGVEFQPKTLKLALVEGGRGRIGSIMDRVLLFCYRFNPEAKRYALYGYNIMRAGGALTLLLLAAFFLPFWMRERNKA